jgi:hypothetical protein
MILAKMGRPSAYPSVRSLLKGAGLNLKEASSGKHQGQLKITKRGPGAVRRWLFMAVLRWIQEDPVPRAWYTHKVARSGGKFKMKAIVALMRKLAAGLWHAARGKPFDSRKLFDLRRLRIESNPLPAPGGLFGRGPKTIASTDSPSQGGVTTMT